MYGLPDEFYHRYVMPQLPSLPQRPQQGVAPAMNNRGSVMQAPPQQQQQPGVSPGDLLGTYNQLDKMGLFGGAGSWAAPGTIGAGAVGDPFALAAGGAPAVDVGMLGAASADPFLAAAGGSAPVDVGMVGMAGADPFLAASGGIAPAAAAGPELAGGAVAAEAGGGLSSLGLGSALPGAAGIGWALPAVAGIGILGSIMDWW